MTAAWARPQPIIEHHWDMKAPFACCVVTIAALAVLLDELPVFYGSID